MRDGMRADRDQRVGRERFQFIPGHAELAANGGFVDAMARAQRADFARQVVFARQRTQPVVQPLERVLLGGNRRGIETGCRAADPGFDRGRPGDHPFQRRPPQPAGALGEIAGDVDGHGCVKLPHDRQREIPVVAIAIVEGEAGEAPRKIAIDQPLMHLVHGHDVDPMRPKMRQHHAQEFRRDFEAIIGLETGVATRPDMVQHENRADAREQRSHQTMRAGKI